MRAIDQTQPRPAALQSRKARRPLLLAIAGGSGSGKSWLATKLETALAPNVLRICLDDFYRDRSHLTPARRARLNFDHPRAIDWNALENALKRLHAGHPARVPSYDFKTHTRLAASQVLRPKPLIVVEGLWLLRRPALRRLFALRIFLECPARTRLKRRLARDGQSRGRTRESVQAQFHATVQPMHRLFVAPQVRWAHVRLRGTPGNKEIKRITQWLRTQNPFDIS
ncbi:MAG TPA: zeta toxin family protein [Verrucomicrobiae bacterium]|nr:zeta toxin family protein [Verrucomicrobiae bacterium]